MCSAPKISAPAPAPAAPPVLEQLAPKSASSTDKSVKRSGLSRYKFTDSPIVSQTNSLAGISKKSTLG